MFQAPIINEHAGATIIGSVQVNGSANNGAGSVTLMGAPASTDLNLQFCPFFNLSSNGNTQCFGVATVHTDASGNGQASFQFPQSGIFFGIFAIPFSGDPHFAATGYTNTSMPDFHASIQRASQVRDVDFTGLTVGSDQITSGSLNIHGTTMSLQVAGAVPSSTYMITQCPGGTGSGCSEVTTFNTDASGTASVNLDLTKDFGPTFSWAQATIYFFRGNDLEYVAGFKVQ